MARSQSWFIYLPGTCISLAHQKDSALTFLQLLHFSNPVFFFWFLFPRPSKLWESLFLSHLLSFHLSFFVWLRSHMVTPAAAHWPPGSTFFPFVSSSKSVRNAVIVICILSLTALPEVSSIICPYKKDFPVSQIELYIWNLMFFYFYLDFMVSCFCGLWGFRGAWWGWLWLCFWSELFWSTHLQHIEFNQHLHLNPDLPSAWCRIIVSSSSGTWSLSVSLGFMHLENLVVFTCQRCHPAWP